MADVTIAIPTYRRGACLVETLDALIHQERDLDILVLDQTPSYEPRVQAEIERLQALTFVRWLKLPDPGIPESMNVGLREASGRIVLFLDDDVIPSPELVSAHRSAYDADEIWAVNGQVLQPGEEPCPLRNPRGDDLEESLDFAFNSDTRCFINNAIACNFSVLRARALEVGGFDENFRGVAYRFETEFCRRVTRAGGLVRFEPAAAVRHLRAPRGGTRARGGNHLTTWRPHHSVGAYYFTLLHYNNLSRALPRLLQMPLKAVSTRFHVRHPWWVGPKLVGEVRALAWALQLWRSGPRHVRSAPLRASS